MVGSTLTVTENAPPLNLIIFSIGHFVQIKNNLFHYYKPKSSQICIIRMVNWIWMRLKFSDPEGCTFEYCRVLSGLTVDFMSIDP